MCQVERSKHFVDSPSLRVLQPCAPEHRQIEQSLEHGALTCCFMSRLLAVLFPCDRLEIHHAKTSRTSDLVRRTATLQSLMICNDNLCGPFRNPISDSLRVRRHEDRDL